MANAENIMAYLPPGTGVIYRGFGREGSHEQAQALARLARRNKHVFLIGAESELAFSVQAQGVHVPERMMGDLPRLRARYPGFLWTVAAHSPFALRRAEALGVDAALFSKVFPSQSPGAGRPVGVIRLSLWLQDLSLPVYALGGVDTITLKKLYRTPVRGFAAVSVFASLTSEV